MGCFQVVHRHAGAEEALNLAAVKVYGDDSIRSHGLNQDSDVGGGDGHAGAHLAVLPRVSIVRDYRSNSPEVTGKYDGC